MKGLYAAAKKAGLDQAPLSVRELAKTFKLPEPISLLWLLENLEPDQIVFETGNAVTGHASGSARFGLLSSGWASFKGELTAHPLFASKYAFAAVLNHVDDHGETVGIHKDGKLEPGKKTEFQVDAHHPWITANWDQIKNKGFKWKLHTETEGGPGEVLKIVMEALGFALIAAFIVLWLHSEAEGSCQWEKGPQGEAIRRCHLQ